MFRVLLSTLVIFFLFVSNGYCQRKDSVAQIVPFVPAGDNGADLERKIEAEIPAVANFGFEKYLAVAEDALSLCNTDSCRKSAQQLLDYRYMAETRCDSCKGDSIKRICYALKNGNCDGLNDRGRSVCVAFSSDSEKSIDTLLANATTSTVTRSDEAEALGIYWGFKKYNYLACQKYLGSRDISFSKRFACKIMFSSNPQEELEKILRDLAIFNIARKENQPTYCSSIKDQKIKNACLDTNIKDITVIR